MILVTGGTGLVGSHLLFVDIVRGSVLINMYCKLLCVCDLSYASGLHDETPDFGKV